MATRRTEGKEPLRTGRWESEGVGRGATVGGPELQGVEGSREEGGMGEKIKNRASEMVESGKEKVAERIDQTGERLERRAERLETQGTVRRQAGKVMHRAGDALESGAGYLRTHEIGTIGDDLTRQIRNHPYLSVGAALGTGFMLGRLFGGGEEEESEREREEFEERFRSGRQRTSAFDRMKGQMGNAVMGGMSAMVARRLRDSIAGR